MQIGSARDFAPQRKRPSRYRMISINLIRGEFPASEKALDQVLCKVAPSWYSPRPPQSLSSAGLPPSLHPRLMERLLGKSPLRLVVERQQVENGIWKEKLECGHETTTFQEFVWAENNSLVRLEPTAKRRRCQKCKPVVAPVLKTTAEITADQKRAELIHKQKLKFGSLFEAMCFPSGELRPALSEAELMEKLCSATKRSNVSQLPTAADTETVQRETNHSAKFAPSTSSHLPTSITPKAIKQAQMTPSGTANQARLIQFPPPKTSPICPA